LIDELVTRLQSATSQKAAESAGWRIEDRALQEHVAMILEPEAQR